MYLQHIISKSLCYLTILRTLNFSIMGCIFFFCQKVVVNTPNSVVVTACPVRNAGLDKKKMESAAWNENCL